MDSLSAHAEESSPDFDDSAIVRYSLRPDLDLCALQLPDICVASLGHGVFSCSGVYAKFQIVWSILGDRWCHVLWHSVPNMEGLESRAPVMDA